MAKVYTRTCVKAWQVTAGNGDHFEVTPGKDYTTSKTWPEGDCTVFTHFWVRVPVECFSAPRPLGQKLNDAEAEYSSWKCADLLPAGA